VSITLSREQHVRSIVATALRKAGYVVSTSGAYISYPGGRVHVVSRTDRGRKSNPPQLWRISVDGLLFVQALDCEIEAVARWVADFIVGEVAGSTKIPPVRLTGLLGDGSDAPSARSTANARLAVESHEQRLAAIRLRAKIRTATKEAA
jgi:hypothetical protein